MLSAYTWSQFGLFILALVLFYYLVVGLLYYREELSGLLSSRREAGRPLVAAGLVDPPALVRPTSAFARAAPGTDESAAAAADEEAKGPAAGAAENLPTAAELVVGGELPASTALATGQDESTSETTPLAAAATPSAQPAAQVQDETRTEEADQADERLAALVRQEGHLLPSGEESRPAVPAREPDILRAGPRVGAIEPLASFEEPVASLLDIITAEPPWAQLVAAESVSEYIALLQAGQNPPMPPALQGSCLAEQMAQHLDHYNAELAALFAEGEG